jgi:uncharacterized protein (DUF1330 family)
MMPAYVIVEIEVTNPEGYATYREQAPSIVAAYGGKYIVRGGALDVLEGDWQPKRLVILEFPSVEQAKAWWSSEEYRDPKHLRQQTTHSNMIVVEGL